MESNVQLIDEAASSDNVEDKKDQRVDHLSGLEETCFSMIISYLDSESILTLSTVCSKIRERLSSMYLFSVTIPFSSEFLKYIQNNPYDVNKYVLSLKIVNPVPDSSQTLEEVVTSTSRQLLLLNLSRVFAVSIKFAFNVSDEIREFRLAFLSFLQIVVNFKFVSKVHLSVYPEFLLNLSPEHMGLKCIRKFMMLKEFGLTFIPHEYQKEIGGENVQSMVEHFISLLDVEKFIFSTVSNNVIFDKKLKFANNKIKHLKLMVPQEFQYKVEMEKLESQILVFNGSTETYHVSSKPTFPAASDSTDFVSSELDDNLNNNNVVVKNVVDEKMMRDADDLRNAACPGDDDIGTKMIMEVPEPLKCGDDGVLTLVPNPKEANPPTTPHAEHSNHFLKSQSFLEEDDVKKIPDLTPKSTRHRRILKPRSVKLTKRPKKKDADKTELIVKDPADVFDSTKDKENVRLEDFNLKTSVLVPDSIFDIHKKTTKSPGKRKRKFVDDQGDKKHDQDDSKCLKMTTNDIQLGSNTKDRSDESSRNSVNVEVNSKILVQVAKAKSSKSKTKPKFTKGKLKESKEGGKPKLVKKKTKVDKNGKVYETKETPARIKLQTKTNGKEKKQAVANKSFGKSKNKIKGSVHRRVRCGTCEGCLSVNCGSCRYCLDMTCFGGNNKLRQACVDRTCIRKLAMMKDASDEKTVTTKKKPK